MYARSFAKFSALALALATSAAVASAQVRTSTTAVVCKDGTQAAQSRDCYFHGGVDVQATQRMQSYGRYGTYPSQSRQNGSWKVGNGQGNGSWKVNGQQQSNGRYDTRDNGRYDTRDNGRYDTRDNDRYGRYDQRADRRDDDRADRRHDQDDDDDRGADRGRGQQHHDNGKHLGQYKHGKRSGRGDRD